MRRYILTGTPGAGKTTVLRGLEALGFAVVEEAATAVIARGQAGGDTEPWIRPDFVDRVVALQYRRQTESSGAGAGVRFHDRSPVCTHALSRYLGRPVSRALADELERIAELDIYERQVFFIRNLGFCEPTAARRIGFEESLTFERIHEQSYRAFGFELVDIPPDDVAERVETIRSAVAKLAA